MATVQVRVDEFNAGLLEYIALGKPIAVTHGGRIVGLFVPTPLPAPTDQEALAHPADQPTAVPPLHVGEVDALIREFDAPRKGAIGRE